MGDMRTLKQVKKVAITAATAVLLLCMLEFSDLQLLTRPNLARAVSKVGDFRRNGSLRILKDVNGDGRKRAKFIHRRLLRDDKCNEKDISITQSRDGTSGIPLYSVQITNTCTSDCAPADIHVNCGWFASSPPPNPKIFTRVAFNDCLVNNGKPLQQGNIIHFQYRNSFMYSLTFKSAKFCRG